MRGDTINRAAFTALLTLTVAGCGGTGADKVGGAARAPKATVLTMANISGDSGELDAFANTAARLSGGTLRIEFKNEWRGGTTDFETGMIGDVKAGKADLGWAGSRAFDSVGVTAFDALHAPLLIDSYALQGKTLESPLVGEMLGALEPLGVTGLGILPGPLRRPLGVKRLLRPADYAGKSIGFSRSNVGKLTLKALGARAAEIPAGGAIDAYEGVESQLLTMEGSGYTDVARYLTANVNLWPRPMVVFMNQAAYDRLDARQRDALRAATRVALAGGLARNQRDDSESAGNLCRQGVKFVTASDADLAALRRAVQPVYDRLGQDAATKAAIARIQAIKDEAAATPDAPACGGAPPRAVTGKVTPIDGVYRRHTTTADLRAAGAPEGDINPENYGDFETVYDRGRWTQKQGAGDTAKGTYTVKGDIVTMVVTDGAGGPARNKPGERFDYRWSLYRDQLTLGPVPGKVSPTLPKPWRRIGDAP